MKVSIDRDGCIGCGSCVLICPQVFRIAEDGFSEVYAQPAPDNESKVREAAENCPVEVIKVDT